MRDENDWRSASPAGCVRWPARPSAIYLEAEENNGTSRRARAMPRCTRSTRRAASSAATAKKPAPSAPSSWARTTSWRSTARTSSSGTRPICSCRPPRQAAGMNSGQAPRSSPADLPDLPDLSMMIGALGDIHGEFDTVQDIMRRHADVPFWLQVGTSPATTASTSHPPRPSTGSRATTKTSTWWPQAAAGRSPSPTLHYLSNGALQQPGAWRALGGMFAPSWYNAPASGSPPSRGTRPPPLIKLGKRRDDKRRHFVKDEVLACKALAGHRRVPDARGAEAVLPAGRHIDAARPCSNEILTTMRPRLHLFGHHHEFTDSARQGVRSIGSTW